jgi:hypothetical protein
MAILRLNTAEINTHVIQVLLLHEYGYFKAVHYPVKPEILIFPDDTAL